MAKKHRWAVSESEDYEFDVHDISAQWTTASVVFIITYQSEDGWVPVYIGQVKNAREQMDRHPYVNAAANAGATHIHALGAPSGLKRQRLVEALVAYHQPVGNAQCP